MNAPAQTTDPIVLSGDLDNVDGAPEPDGELVLLVEEWFEVTKRANVAATADGADRKVIKPTITTIDEKANTLDLIDLLHEIAWADCCQKGRKTRYVAQLFTQAEGRARLVVKRAYFNLAPDGGENSMAVESNADFNLGLQNFALRCLDRQSIAAHRTQLREGATQKLAYDSLSEMRKAVRATAATKVDEITATASEQRKTALSEAIFSLIPAAAAKYAFKEKSEDKPTNGTAKLQLSEQLPIDRVRDYLTGSELNKLESALGPELWKTCIEAKDFGAVKGVLTGLDETLAVAVFEAVPEGKLAEMAGWG